MFLRGFCLVTVMGLFGSNSFASGLDAVELDLVPSDILVDCNRSFFKSSNPEVKSLFVTPHVVAGRSPIDGDEPQVHVSPSPEAGKYIFSVGIFFPRDAEDAINAYELRDAHANFCNFESVRHFINKGIEESEQLQEIVHLPLTSAEIRIANLELEPHIIGRTQNIDTNNELAQSVDCATAAGDAEVCGEDEVDILEYNDNSYTAEFLIDDDQLEYINNRMSRDEGLQIDVKYRFESRKKNGSVHVTADGTSIASNLQASVGGRKFLTKADIKINLQSAINESNVHIDVKAGESESFNKVVDKIIDQVLASVDVSAAAEKLIPKEPVGGERKATELIEVDAVVEYLSSKKQFEFGFSESSAPGNTTAETTVRVKSEPLDPYLMEIVLKDGFGPETFPDLVKQGETIRIAPAYDYIADRVWKERVSYLTEKQLDTLGIYDIFMAMKGGNFSVGNVESKGQLLAEGSWSGALNMFGLWTDTFRWRRIQRFPVRTQRMKINMFDVGSIEDLAAIPVDVAFSQVGGKYFRFTLEELLEENEYWNAQLEFGSVVLTAKQDLGLLTFRMNAKRPYYEQVDKNGKLRYQDKDKGCQQLDPQQEGYCEFRFNFKVGMRAMDEVVQEQRCQFGYECDLIDSEHFPIKGRVDKWALDMYQAIHISITRPQIQESHIEVQPPEVIPARPIYE